MAKTAIEIIHANYKARKEVQGKLRELDEKCTTENRAYTEAETAEVEEHRSELEAIDGRITANLEMEMREQALEDGFEKFLGLFADREKGNLVDNRSAGDRVADDDEYRAFVERGGSSGHFHVDLEGLDFRAVTDTTLGATSAGALTRAQRLDRIGRDFLDRRTYLLDLLPHIQVSQGSIEYVQDQSPLADLANKGVEVAEGGSKPQAGITLAVIQEPTATIPAWVNITRQAAADVPQVQGYLDGRLRYSLKRRADIQSINGNGTSPNLKGLANRSGILLYAPGGAEARYRSIRHGIAVMENNESVPEIIVLNPSDAEAFDLSNDAASGLHAVDASGGIAERGPRTAWGLTQVRSTAVAAGTALLIDPMAVAVFDRMQPTAYTTDSHDTNFTKNILTLLLEVRLGLGLFDPSGVLKITFNGAA